MTSLRAPTISVIVDNYNYGDFLRRSIESALAQGVDVEVIVVDDGSTDESRQIIDAYGDRIVAVLKENGGQASAFNAGFELATGELVMLLDADDMLLPGAADRLRSAAASAPDAAMFMHSMRFVDGDDNELGDGLPEVDRQLPRGDLRGRLLCAPDDIPWQPSSGLAFRRRALMEVLPIPPESFRTCADAYLVNTVPLRGPVVAIDQAGAAYRRHASNQHLTDSFDLDRLLGVVQRTDVTHDAIRRQATALGLISRTDELDLESVTDVAARMVLARLRPAAVSERRHELFKMGWTASLRRRDAGVVRKGLIIGWFGVTALAPRSLVPALSQRVLTR